MDDRLFPVDAVKRCCTCKQVKPLTEFNLFRRSKDGRQPACRDCNSAYHYANWDRHMSQIRTRKERRQAENKARLIAYLLERSCVDCGEDDLIVLEFDHLRDKSDNVSSLVADGREWDDVLREIAKCEIVCANCHRRRTAARANSYRHRAVRSDETQDGD